MTVHGVQPDVRIELSNDPRFSRRVQRLGSVSLVAPGLIWWLAATRLDLAQPLFVALFAGWWLMPMILFASIPFPSVRPLLIVPATLITAPVLAIVAGQFPGQPLSGLGWVLIAAGLLLGSIAGGWFWFRWAPVPDALDDPFSPARRRLIRIHVALICAGVVLAAFG